jgi:hypothetical protein
MPYSFHSIVIVDRARRFHLHRSGIGDDAEVRQTSPPPAQRAFLRCDQLRPATD